MTLHDFKNYPELLDSELVEFGYQSPHKQILESFSAKVVKVHDGDTVTLRWSERDFDFPVRLANTAAPEVGGKKGKETGGDEAQAWLEKRLFGQDVFVLIDLNNRVDKFGRLLGRILLNGIDIGEQAILEGVVKPFSQKNEGLILFPIKNIEWKVPVWA